MPQQVTTLLRPKKSPATRAPARTYRKAKPRHRVGFPQSLGSPPVSPPQNHQAHPPQKPSLSSNNRQTSPASTRPRSHARARNGNPRHRTCKSYQSRRRRTCPRSGPRRRPRRTTTRILHHHAPPPPPPPPLTRARPSRPVCRFSRNNRPSAAGARSRPKLDRRRRVSCDPRTVRMVTGLLVRRCRDISCGIPYRCRGWRSIARLVSRMYRSIVRGRAFIPRLAVKGLSVWISGVARPRLWI